MSFFISIYQLKILLIFINLLILCNLDIESLAIERNAALFSNVIFCGKSDWIACGPHGVASKFLTFSRSARRL